MDLRENIKKWRLKRGLTQEGLARKANIPLVTFVKIETGGVTNPRMKTVHAISKALGVKLDDLLT